MPCIRALTERWFVSQVVRHRSAKPSTAVRFRHEPHSEEYYATLFGEAFVLLLFFMGGKAYSSSPPTLSLSMQRVANVLLMYRECGNREVGGYLLYKVIGKSTNFAGNF